MRVLLLIISIFISSSLFACDSNKDSFDLTGINDLIILEINKYRVEQGLCELEYDSRADSSAKYHSKYLAEIGMITHYEEDSVPGMSNLYDIDDRMGKFGVGRYWVMGENIAAVYDTVELCRDTLVKKIINGWKNSPEHNKMMLNSDIVKIGVNYTKGTHQSYYYEDFETGDIILDRLEMYSWTFVMNVFTEK